MKTINSKLLLLISVVLFLLFQNISFTQISSIKGEIYTTEITVKFKSKAFDNVDAQGFVSITNLRTEFKSVKDFFVGKDEIRFQKIFKQSQWGDTIGYNMHGETVKVDIQNNPLSFKVLKDSSLAKDTAIIIEKVSVKKSNNGNLKK